MTADPQASDQPRYGARGRRAVALIALALGLAGFVISAAGLATQLLPRQFTAAQQQQIKNWEIASRWQQLTAGRIFPASVRYQLPATVLQDATSLNLDARRIGIAPQSGCGAGVTTSAAAAVLRREGCRVVLRATYVDATWSYVMTVGVAVLPSHAAAVRASQSLSQTQLTAARNAEGGQLAPGILVVRYHGTAAAMYDYSRQISASFRRGPVPGHVRRRVRGQPAARPRGLRPLLRHGDDAPGPGRRSVGGGHAGGPARQPALPGSPRMLIRRRIATLAVLGCAVLGCAASLAVLPATAASANSVRDSQQWVLDMMNVPAAWQVTRGAGVIVAVIDSGVYPYVSDLAGSVRNGPDYTGVSTPPSNPDWGVHGTWMASLIAGHGHGPGGGSGVIGVAPRSTILSIRVIPDRADPNYRRYEHEQEPAIQDSLAQGIDYAVQHGAKVISMSIGYSAPNGAVKQALADAFSHGVVVVASAGNSGAPAASNAGQRPGVLPGRLPRRDQRGRRGHEGGGGQLLQRKRVRPGGRARCGRARPRAGTGSTGWSAAPARPARWWPGWRP